ncbi:hypothetical protein H0H87_005785, partial [Tephrocybe sp. NHM501043]
MVELWRAKFNGEAPAADAAPDAGKAAKKGKGKKAAPQAAVDPNVPKTPEMLALEAKIADQGQVV